MKKVISALTAAAMCASMSASVMTAFAAYSANDVSMYLKAVEAGKGTISEDGKTVTFATAADAANAKIVVQSFIVADTENPDITAAGIAVTPSNPAIVLGGGVDFTAADGDAVSYTIGDKTFSTNMFVHCFGTAVTRGKNTTYGANTATAPWGDSNDWPASWNYTGPQMYALKWTGNATGSSIEFLSSKSDELPFAQFEATLGDIAEGTYTIEYQDEWYHVDEATTMKGNYVTNLADEQTAVTNHTGLTIVVGDANATQPSEEEPTTPSEEPTTPSEDPTEPSTPSGGNEAQDPASFDKETFYFENVTIDKATAVADGGVQVDIKVAKNEGTAAVQGFFTINGKKPTEVFTIDAANGIWQSDTGYGYGGISNPSEGALAAVASTKDPVAGNKALADGSAVFSIWVEVDENTPAGAYTFDFTELKVSNYDEVTREVATQAGVLLITDGEEPTEPSSEEQPSETTEPTTEEQPSEEPTTEEQQPTETTPAPVGDYLYGDVNHNGTVELVDIVMLNRFLTGFGGQELDAYQTVVANCYRDNGESDADTKQSDLNGKDSMSILKKLIGLVATLPENV